MGNGIGAGQGHIYQMLFAVGHALFHGTDYIPGFAHANTDLAFLIADHHNGAKTEFFTAFHYLGNAAEICTTRSCQSVFFSLLLLSLRRLFAMLLTQFHFDSAIEKFKDPNSFLD